MPSLEVLRKTISPVAAKSTYSFVPLQDFTKNSDIDWSKPVKEIDTQLYKNYALESHEVDFIEKMIKEMG